MSTSVDTTTKLANLLPTGTFLTFQVVAPLATNSGNCGVTEKVLTAITLLFLVTGCIITSFTDSYTAPDGKVYNGFLTRQGLWVPSYEAAEVDGAEDDSEVVPRDGPDATSKVQNPRPLEKQMKINKQYIVSPNFVIRPSDYVNAFLSAVAFLTLTLFTDPVSTCFYPNLSETLLKTLPVLIAAMLSFFCSFSGKVRHGYGNSYPGRIDTLYKPITERVGTMPRRSELSPLNNETPIDIEDGHDSTTLHRG